MWTYRGHKVSELPVDVKYMVYCIHYTNGQKYIGSKVVRSKQRAKPLKGMRSNAVRLIERESNWKEYIGSSKLTKELTIHSKVILYLCTDKRSATYLEVRELMKVDAPMNKDYVNENINGKWYNNALDGVYKGQVFKGLFDEINTENTQDKE